MRSTTSPCASFTSVCNSLFLRSNWAARRCPCDWARAFCSSFQVLEFAAICWRRSLICLLSASSSFCRGANCVWSSAEACLPSAVVTIAWRTFNTAILLAPAAPGAEAPCPQTTAVPRKHNVAAVATRMMFLEFTVFSLLICLFDLEHCLVPGGRRHAAWQALTYLTGSRSNFSRRNPGQSPTPCVVDGDSRKPNQTSPIAFAGPAQSEQYSRDRNTPAITALRTLSTSAASFRHC